jgi:hypothetical protein
MDEHNEVELEMGLVLAVGHIVMVKQQPHYTLKKIGATRNLKKVFEN